MSPSSALDILNVKSGTFFPGVWKRLCLTTDATCFASALIDHHVNIWGSVRSRNSINTCSEITDEHYSNHTQSFWIIAVTQKLLPRAVRCAGKHTNECSNWDAGGRNQNATPTQGGPGTTVITRQTEHESFMCLKLLITLRLLTYDERMRYWTKNAVSS